MKRAILGISAFYHDSAASIIVDGEIVAAAHEERFTRIKGDASFPINSIKYVLNESGFEFNELLSVAFYDKPLLKFERLLETYHGFSPNGLISFLSAIPIWMKEKLFMKQIVRKELKLFGNSKIPIYFPEHHLSHAASAYYPSNFNEAAILTIDGVGEWATATIGYGEKNNISIIKELHFPHSVGLLYSAFTYYTGFRVNSGEYKLMGLAPYGNENSDQTKDFYNKIIETLVDIREDGSILLNMDYFDFATGLKMTKDKKWEKLFNLPPRSPETELTQDYMNMALAIQKVTEKIVFKLAKEAKKLTKCNNLVMAGGVALNSVANGKLVKNNIFDQIWIQPAAGDAGGSLGAALATWYIVYGESRQVVSSGLDSMKGAYLGPEFGSKEINKMITKFDANYKFYDNFSLLANDVASLIDKGNIIGWFQGRMEFGPRALGNRSILGDARNPEMQKKMNLQIKYREGFRPFAPSVIEEDIQRYFDLDMPTPYMLLVVPIAQDRRNKMDDNYNELSLYDRLYKLRSDVPAITHIDFSARPQSVNRKTNPRYWELINSFKNLTEHGLIINTSFNVRGEPIVCNPIDAFNCFMNTEMDYLVVGDYLFNKKEQDESFINENWKKKFELD